jgi:uncharacterized membrane protein
MPDAINPDNVPRYPCAPVAAMGYLGWFVGRWVLFITTAAVVIVTWRRQLASTAWSAMGE